MFPIKCPHTRAMFDDPSTVPGISASVANLPRYHLETLWDRLRKKGQLNTAEPCLDCGFRIFACIFVSIGPTWVGGFQGVPPVIIQLLGYPHLWKPPIFFYKRRSQQHVDLVPPWNSPRVWPTVPWSGHLAPPSGLPHALAQGLDRLQIKAVRKIIGKGNNQYPLVNVYSLPLKMGHGNRWFTH